MRGEKKVISALINSFLIFLISLDQYLLFDHQYNQNINCRFPDDFILPSCDFFASAKLYFNEACSSSGARSSSLIAPCVHAPQTLNLFFSPVSEIDVI